MLSLRDTVKSSGGDLSRPNSPWCPKGPIEVVWASDQNWDASPKRNFGPILLEKGSRVGLELARGITYCGWPGSTLGPPKRSVAGEKKVYNNTKPAATSFKWREMNGWISL